MHPNRQTQTIRVISITLMVTALLMIGSRSAGAQSEQVQKAPPSMEELKKRLLQLEQAVQELKGQINATEQSPKASNALFIPSAGGAAVEAASSKSKSTPGSSTNSDLSDANPANANVTTAPKAAPKPAQAESTFEIYSNVMLDFGYQFKQGDPGWFDVVRPTKLPSFKDQFAPDGKIFADVRQTRFGVKSSTPTSLGDLKTHFEFDLFGTGADAGQTTIHLRHAYGELGQFGAGQYWSPFMDEDAFPNSFEYWGPNGMVAFRNVQFRWMPIKGASRVTIALERPGASADLGVYRDRIELVGVRPQLQWPDLSWEARLGRGWGYVEVAGLFRQLKWKDTNDDLLDLSGSDFGWGLNFSSGIKFGARTVGKFQFVYGEGVQNYMNDAPTDVGVKNNFGDPVRPVRGIALPVLGTTGFIDHNWTTRLSTAIGYSFMDIQNSDGQAADAYNQGHYALTNLLWTPVQNFTVGGEFQFGRRLNFRDGFNVNDYRLHFAVKYNFSKVFKF